MRVSLPRRSLHSTACPHRRRLIAALRQSLIGGASQGDPRESHQCRNSREIFGRKHNRAH